MRVRLIVPGDPGTLTGGYAYDRRIVDGLAGLGVEAGFMELPSLGYGRDLAAGLDPGLGGRLAREVERCGADAVLVDELAHPRLFSAVRELRSGCRARVVGIVHHLKSSEPGPWLVRRVVGLVEGRFLAGLDGLIAGSEATRRAVEGLAGRGLPCRVVRPGVEEPGAGPGEEAVRRRCLTPGPLRLLFLGSVIRRKGLLDLLSALALVEPALARLTIIGDESAEPAHARFVRAVAKGLPPGQVRILGRLDQAGLDRELGDHHLMAMPFSYEGFGMVFQEAAGFGLPSLVSTRGGALEAAGCGGIGVKPGNILGAAALIRELALDRGRLAGLSLKALRRVATLPTWQDQARAVVRFLEGL